MTNISAMRAIAELNKLQDQKNQVNQGNPPPANNKPNSIFTAGAGQAANLDNQIAAKQNELNGIKDAEKKPIQGNGPEFAE